MALSLYEGRGRQDPLPMYACAVNLVFAGLCMGWWSLASLLVGEALSWATWVPMSGRPEFLEYPFLLLWAVPVGCSSLAWVAQRGGMDRLALCIAMVPVMLFTLVIGWYWLAPLDWR